MKSTNSNQLKPYIIAEIGLNHEGDIQLCKEIITAAKKAGCNAVKLQSLDYFDGNISKNIDTFVETKKYGRTSVANLLQELLLSDEEHGILAEYCIESEIDFISTPFGFRHIDLLDEIGVDKFKIASQDIIHLNFLKKIAKKQKPIVMSVGMGTIGEIEVAIETIRKYNDLELSILHCVSQYPTTDEDANLRKIETLKNIFNLKIGYSDHTLGITAAIVATTLGAEIIEKHFTYDKTAEGWDHAISADYDEMTQLCKETRRVQSILGTGFWDISEAEIAQREKMRRSIVSKTNIKEGDILTEENIEFKRPGNGIRPDELKYVLGRKINRNIKADELIQWEDLL